MGASSSRARMPVLQTSTEAGENDRIKYAAASMQGWSRNIEDAYAVVPDLYDNTSFFGIYDGHGGPEVALLCARLFHTELRNHPDYQNNFTRAMKRVFFRMDEVLLQSDEWKELIKPDGDWIQFLKTGVCAKYWPFTQTTPYVAPQGTGSTACIVVIRGNKIILGNVGDSRCVLSMNGQAIQLTTVHKPNELIEKQRIRRAGRKVIRDMTPVITRGHLQSYQLGVYRIDGVLSVSRVIGHFAFKQNKDLPPEEQAATCNPNLSYMEIDNDMEFLVIASGGICGIYFGSYVHFLPLELGRDCMTPKCVVDFVRRYLRMGINDLRAICERLLIRGLPSEENATAILVQFKSNAAGLPPLTESDGGCPQEEAATGGNRTERTLPTVVEDEEDDEDGEAGSSETQPLMGTGSSEMREE